MAQATVMLTSSSPDDSDRESVAEKKGVFDEVLIHMTSVCSVHRDPLIAPTRTRTSWGVWIPPYVPSAISRSPSRPYNVQRTLREDLLLEQESEMMILVASIAAAIASWEPCEYCWPRWKVLSQVWKINKETLIIER